MAAILFWCIVCPGALSGQSTSIGLVEEFDQGSGGWLAGFADYRLGDGGADRLAEIRALPTDSEKRGYYLQAHNPSADTFLFLKRPLSAADGVQPNGLYRADFLIDLVSNASEECPGAGGSPADVYLKIGVSPTEPVAHLRGRVVRLNLDKGSAQDDGVDSQTVDTIANGLPCEDSPRYAAVQQYHAFPRHVRAGPDGTIWLYVGLDSAFEGRTGVYFDRIVVLLTLIE